MSKIISLQAENVKRLTAVEIAPKGHLVVVGGKNEQGKTSLLDSITMALGGKDEIPLQPVRNGQEKARVVLETEDLVIKRTFTSTGGTNLVVENKEGMRYSSPQQVLDKLTGKLTFDPLAFMRLSSKDQAEALKKLVGLDFSKLDAERKKLYDERTLVNKQADMAKAKVGFMPHDPEAPAEEQSVTAIVAERDAAKEHNEKKALLERAVCAADGDVKDAVAKRSTLLTEIDQLEQRLKGLRIQVAEYDENLPALRTRLAAANEALLAFVPVDLAPINSRLANAEQLNVKVRENKARDAALREAQQIKAKSEALTSQIDEIDRLKAEQLAGAKFPVPGLSFNENGLLYNGVPLEQASGAGKLRVSVAMAAAMNPKLRVMIIRDGSLLDDDNMTLLGKLAEEYDVQVWLEVVSTDSERCQIIISDGAVTGAPVAEAIAS